MVRFAWLVVLFFVIVAILAAPYTAREAAHYLVVADVVKPSRAIVVLSGDVPFRAMEAAEGYKQNWAKQVWLTQAGAAEDDEALRALKIDKPDEHEYSRKVLVALGVPASAIRALPERNLNTADELRAVIEHMKTAGGGPVVLVTSKPQARRVRTIWQRVGGDPMDAVIRFRPGHDFDPNQWWSTTDDARTFMYEWGGIVNAWFGFPLSARN
jgi:uncharacterized SAM-binding protein YcdF (DUF218 family)